MKTPPFLQPSSRVRIVSTARKISETELAPAIKLLKSWGLIVELGEHVYDRYRQFAGTDEARLEDLQHALDDESLDMIWCSRGGYGTVKLIDQLDFSRFVERPKWVVGYSDVTGLLCHITERLNVQSIHATMPINIKEQLNKRDLDTIYSLQHLLFGKSLSYGLDEHKLNRPGNCSGELIGGNLSIVYSILGSSSAPRTNDKILFLEDLDEYLYHVDRMMVNLKRNGLLGNLAGLVVGGMSDMNDNTVPYGTNAEEIIHDHVKAYDYPVYFGFPAGHISPNLALPFGKVVSIKNNTLIVQS